MKLFRHLTHTEIFNAGCVATIGNFDGLHLGHEHLLRTTVEQARAEDLPAVMILFEPQPKEYFQPDDPPARLTSFREKLEILKAWEIDYIFCLRFDERLSQWSAHKFVETVMLETIQIKHLIIGDDFRFGKNRQGDVAFLQTYTERHDFTITHLKTLTIQGDRVSSTRIREALHVGKFALAQALLGRPYHLSGRVVMGDQFGRCLGFPTANLRLNRLKSPVNGVFAVEVLGLGQAPIKGVANVGKRPTVDGTKALIEVHLFDFSREIYGEHLHVTFLKQLRQEQRFDSLDLLKEQIQKDCQNARKFFSSP